MPAIVTVIEDFHYLVICCPEAAKLEQHLPAIKGQAYRLDGAEACDDCTADGCDRCSSKCVVGLYTGSEFMKVGRTRDYNTVMAMLDEDDEYEGIVFRCTNLYHAHSLVRYVQGLNHRVWSTPIPNSMEYVEDDDEDSDVSILVMRWEDDDGDEA